LFGFLEDGIVETPAQAAIAGDDDEGDLLDGPDLGKGHIDVFGLELLVDVVENLDEGLGEGAGVNHGFLGSPDLGGRYELHGFGDLLRVLDGSDSIPKLAEAALDRVDYPGGGGGCRSGGGLTGGDAQAADGSAKGERVGRHWRWR